MPDVQCETQLVFEVLDATLASFATVDSEAHADLIDACADLYRGSKPSEVEALLSGPLGRPTLSVSTRGVPSLADCWSSVLALVQAYNAIGTGLTLGLSQSTPTPMTPPHCAEWRWVDGERVLVLNWEVALLYGGRSESVFRASDAAGVPQQVLAMGHAAIAVPFDAAP